MNILRLNTLGQRIGRTLYRAGTSLARSRLRRELMLIEEGRLIARTGLDRQALIDRVGQRPLASDRRLFEATAVRFSNHPAGNDGEMTELRRAV